MENKDNDYRNHVRFALRCITKELIPVSVRLKSTSNSRSRRVKEIIHRAERQLLQDRVRELMTFFTKNVIKLDRVQVKAVVISKTTMEKCTDFINKVREFSFIKIRDRQVNKFNRLMGNKDRELTAQPLANANQSQAKSNSNKWVANLSNIPLSQSQESLLSKAPNYAVAPNPPI